MFSVKMKARKDTMNPSCTAIGVHVFVVRSSAIAVSYTHLDVYKRQEYINKTGAKKKFCRLYSFFLNHQNQLISVRFYDE